MKIKCSKVAIFCLIGILLTAFTVPWLAVIAVAKPVTTDPGWVHWPVGTIWGAGLLMENNTSGDVFFGAKTGTTHTYASAIPGFPPYIWMVFWENNADKSEITRTEPAAPQHYTWYVKMLYNNSGTGDNVTNKIWAELENADTLFIPRNYSVILENKAKGIGPWNLRKENGSINLVDGVTRYATLYVDNAVNVSISPDNQAENVGENLTCIVTVKNTGRYSDNYVLENFDNMGWGLRLADSYFGNVAPGDNRQTTLTVSVGSAGRNTVSVIAEGAYAEGYGSAMAVGIGRSVDVSISPPSQENLRRTTLRYTVTVTDNGTVDDNYVLQVWDNLGWTLLIQPTVTVKAGGSENVILTVTIPPNAPYYIWNNIWVRATSQADNTVKDTDNCTARAIPPEGNPGVSISPPDNQENLRGGTLRYTVTITNPTTFSQDTYTLIAEDNLGWIIPTLVDPSEDSYVYNMTENLNYGDENTLIVGTETAGRYRSYIQLRLPPISGDILSAKFNMYCYDIKYAGSIDVYRVENDDWLENEITWNNQPSFGSIENSIFVENENHWYSWDVTSWVDNQSRVDGIVSMAFETGYAEAYFYSHEGINKPYLEIAYRRVGKPLPQVLVARTTVPASGSENVILTVNIPFDAPYNVWDNIRVRVTSQADNTYENSDNCAARALPPVGNPGVSISPDNQDNFRGGTLRYTVMITNPTTFSQDTYMLQDWDILGWTLSIENEVTVPAGGSENVILTVTIPPNAPYYVWDNIRVRVTSQADNTYENSDNCAARALPPVGNPGVSISPDNQENLRGGTLRYTVMITNPTTFSQDTYMLQDWDTLGWTLSINNRVTVPAGGSENVILTVTIPQNAPYNVWDNIWVEAISQADTTFLNSDNCAARAIPPGVEISISPSENNGSLGGTLNYQVTVKNTSGGLDTYTLKKAYTKDWNLELENTIMISSGENHTVTLTVTIPDNTSLGTWDNITITATSQADNTYDNSASCIARAGIDVFPHSQIGDIGKTITYTVTFCNTSENIDNYALVTTDEFGWTMWFDDNFFESVPSGENRTTTLNVLICSGGDSIYVTASGTYASASATVTAAMPITESVVHGSYTAYNISDTDGPPWVWYGPSQGSQYPPIMVVQRVGSGGVVTGCSATCRNNRWIRGEWDVLLDKAFQWMKSSAKNLLWYEGHSVYNTRARCSDLVADLVENFGYTIDGTTTQPITPDLLAPYDILIIPQMEEGAAGTGGDSSKISDAEVQTINSFVQGGGGFLIMEGADYNPLWGYNYNLVQNKILMGLNLTMDFQNDTIYDIGWTSGTVPVKVNTTTWIGSAYENATGKDNLILYDICSMAPAAPAGIFAEIIPKENNGSPGENVGFLITLANTLGEDNYILTVGDNRGWSLKLDDNLLEIPSNNGAVTTLRVAIPVGATPRTGDLVTVTATSQYDNTVSRSVSCTAWAADNRDVEVFALPGENFGVPGENVSFTVNVKNWGKYADNYALTVEKTKNWVLSLPSSVGPLAGGENTIITLLVSIPEDAQLFDDDVLTITATSQGDSSVGDTTSCTVGVALENWGVRVGILPEESRGIPGENVGFTVTVTNIGKYADNYDLLITDNAHWFPSIVPTRVSLAALGENTAKLTVTIPLTAKPLAGDNIRVRAISTQASGDDTCIARATGENILISISPGENIGAPGENVIFIVTVKNIGGATDNYALENSDNSGWALKLDNTLLTVPAGENRRATLTVSIPDNAENSTRDNIIVKATSRTDNKFNRASCIATVVSISGLGVKVSISPEENSGSPGMTLAFTATVKNTGNVEDTYVLTVKDDASWGASLDENKVTILAGGNTTVTVSVTVPSGAIEGDTTQITVTAISQADSTVKNSASCIAKASAPVGPSRPPILLFLVVGVVAIVIIAVAVLLKTGAISLKSST